ncbi:transcription factor with AP2 domain(s) [Babesia ovis]|uniref:Transcription factor with AP2 domain(S) n=1 Tax=Babesia ovis TaxID=5869 RepID=A0A9W5TC69_BABOV|nr:transcription factor with AP2 domain(s) [Babesia ovis]
MGSSHTEIEQNSVIHQSSQVPSAIGTEDLNDDINGYGSVQLSDLKSGDCIPGILTAHKDGKNNLMSLASIETQPPASYGQYNNFYARSELSFDGDKKSNGYNNQFNAYYGVDPNWPYKCPQVVENGETLQSQLSLDSQASLYSSCGSTSGNKLDGEQQLAGNQMPDFPKDNVPQQPLMPEGYTQKVVATNPVILVDKVERSLIVQWYENSVRREQRISYKKYGNAKAQQRAENLISKLMNGSTFDQLYPEKGPPILTIFENVGAYSVSLTRDRILREWRVDWTNNNGAKMRARWSCKKVGNEEAKSRAETFANSLIQGTFNPRLLHKATGTRLSRNDMKYSAVLNEEDFAKNETTIVHARSRKSEFKEAGAKKKRGTNTTVTRKKGTRGSTNKWKHEQLDYFNSMKMSASDYLSMSGDGTYPGYYNMYSDADSKITMQNGSYDNMAPHGDALIAQNWQNFGDSHKMDYGSSAEWNYNDGHNDYNYNQVLSGLPNENICNMDWMNMNCMENYTNGAVDAPLSVRDLNDDNLQNGESQNNYIPYYHLYPPGPNSCFQDQMSVNNSINESEHFDKDNRNNEQLSYSVPAYQENDVKFTELNSMTQNNGSPLQTGRSSGSNCESLLTVPSTNEDGNAEVNAVNNFERQNSINNMSMSWPNFNNMMSCDYRMNSINSNQEYPQDMYIPDGNFVGSHMMDSKKIDPEMTKQMNTEMPEFFGSMNMEMHNGMNSQNANVVGNMGHVYY